MMMMKTSTGIYNFWFSCIATQRNTLWKVLEKVHEKCTEFKFECCIASVIMFLCVFSIDLLISKFGHRTWLIQSQIWHLISLHAVTVIAKAYVICHWLLAP